LDISGLITVAGGRGADRADAAGRAGGAPRYLNLTADVVIVNGRLEAYGGDGGDTSGSYSGGDAADAGKITINATGINSRSN